ncbi:hypothetical protein BP5796_06865 [Coleophoma crateriformis]|uniref:Uncharacterized protein n=1 Tax=Coleophoma crateriformis TaxID=565419 RepID=A0A3D8RQ86_9HELO|nr:hypothetical protein BP5796_06865 [Coleophoma crateriformis]
MAIDDAQPSDWTLLFKHGRQTILLLVAPLTPVTQILEELLSTIKDRYSDGLPGPKPSIKYLTPDSIHDVFVGIPKDIYEPSKGFQDLDVHKEGSKASPATLDWKDGSILAFRFAKEDEQTPSQFWVEWSSYDEQYGTEAMDEDEDEEEGDDE